jgi:hypothetical protein
MPRNISKQNRKNVLTPPPYDPNTETDEGQKTAAHYWELLRRNQMF